MTSYSDQKRSAEREESPAPSLPPAPSMAGALKGLAASRIETHRADLESQGFDISCLVLHGSLASGLFYGPKDFSKLFDAQPGSERYEVDLLLVVKSPDIFADESAHKLGSVFPLARIEDRELDMWDGVDKVKAAVWEERRDGYTLEWDVLIAPEPFVGLSGLYPAVFSAQEIEWHRELRKFVAGTHPEAYESLKGFQAMEARWRISAAYAMNELTARSQELSSLVPALPLGGGTPQPLQSIVNRWLEGEKDVLGLHRPAIVPSFELKEEFLAAAGNGLSEPEEPAWIRAAEHAQWFLQSKAAARETGNGRSI